MVHIRARMSVLLHICCAPCSISCIEMLREEGMEPTGFWFNPNIHPYKLIMRDEYGLRPFIRAIYPSLENRCGTCYRIRFEETARFAAENGFDGFSSTLFVSPYQNHELLRKTAEKTAEKFGTRFIYRDFRPGFREGQQKARELRLYMQKYCGCVFSEEERYLKKK